MIFLMSRPRTRENLKAEVLDYITHTAIIFPPRLDRLTVPAIADAVQEDNLDRVRGVINDLQTDHQTESITIVEEIVLPKSDEGQRIRRHIASRMRMSRHTYIALFVVLFALYFVFPYLLKDNAPLPPFANGGPPRSLVSFVVLGWFLTYLLDEAVLRFRVFRIVSEDVYTRLAAVTKYTIVLFALLYIGCLILFPYLKWEMSAAIAVTLLGLAFTSSIGLYHIIRERRKGPSER